MIITIGEDNGIKSRKQNHELTNSCKGNINLETTVKVLNEN